MKKQSALENLFRLVKGRELQLKAVVITALASYFLQLYGILLHWPIWAIALGTIIPWIPLFFMKVLWTSKHYGFMALYLGVMLVQAGHVGEHVYQVGEFLFLRENVVPIEGNTFVSEDGLTRSVVRNTDGKLEFVKGKDGALTNKVQINPAFDPLTTDDFIRENPAGSGKLQLVQNANCHGWAWNLSTCPAAHGIFGVFDAETVHFFWDGLILIATIIIMFRFPRNPWAKWGFTAALIHQMEHIYLWGTYQFFPSFYDYGGDILGVHLSGRLNGGNVPAGIMGYNGLVGHLIPALNPLLPNRINLHFIYNSLVIIPMILTFRYQLLRIYDEWLARSIPQLSEEQLISATTRAENVKFAPGEVIFKQGDPADKLYIITKGIVQVIRRDRRSGAETEIARVTPGQYFGEIGVLGRTERTATCKAVDAVECLALTRDLFKELLASSSASYKEVDVVLRRRLIQLGAVKGLPVADSVNADSDTVLKTRMIRDRLQLIQGDELSRVLGSNPLDLPAYRAQPELPVANFGGQPPQYQPQILTPTQPSPIPAQQPQPNVAVVDRPVVEVGNGGYNRGALFVRSGTSTGDRFQITAPRVIIGRRSTTAASSEVPVMQVDDGRVSRQHVEIVAMPDGPYLRDLGSANGTWLNGSQLGGEPVRLQDGAEIRLGTDTVITYRA